MNAKAHDTLRAMGDKREAREREQARLDAQAADRARERARQDFRANQKLQARLRGYEAILRRLDRTEAKRKKKIQAQIAAVEQKLQKK